MKFLYIFLITIQFAFADELVIKNPNKTLTKQKGLNWCWAASLEAINKYYNINTKQEDIIKKWTNLVDFDLEVYKDSPMFIMNPFYFQDNLNKTILKTITVYDVESQIKNNNPVLFFANNHASIIVGIKDDNYLVMDTSYGEIIKKNKDSIKHLTKDDNYSPSSMFFAKK